MKYGLIGNHISPDRLVVRQHPSGSFGYQKRNRLETPLLFDNPTEAARAIALRGDENRFIEIVGVEVTPGETRHEVVELAGMVDLTNLKFALRVPLPGEDGFLAPDHEDVIAREINSRTYIFDSLEDVICLARRNRRYGGLYPVGIRETTTPTTHKIVRL